MPAGSPWWSLRRTAASPAHQEQAGNRENKEHAHEPKHVVIRHHGGMTINRAIEKL
jgi:hypothetical protein